MDTRTFVVGTAGHVDHGKSTLVKYLTGIDPDRLREEKERELTIDLGFAWFRLPSGASASIVDVPGHERFIKNMLAGVGGIDAALLIVAADEGPMPQTIEHLAILDLLGIGDGVVVVTKRDLVEPDWLDLIIEETREVLAPTALAGAPIIPVSSTTGEGVDDLVSALDEVLAGVPNKRSHGRPRLAVDRVFTVSGFGTVVTGTLLGDSLRVGQEVELLPTGMRSRIRGLQVHGESVESAAPGERTAVNLTGVHREDVQRGDLLTVPGWLQPTRLLDARIRLVRDAPRALEQNDPVDFFVGASEASAHVTILAAELLRPGEEGWVQLRFDEPVVAVERDLFIIRQASPSLTIGGGVVVNAHPRRHRRFRDDVIKELETRATGTPLDRLVQLLSEGPRTVRDAASALELGLDEIRELVREGATANTLKVLGTADDEKVDPGRVLMHAGQFEQLSGRAVDLVENFHRQSPLRAGMPREELRSRLDLDARTFDTFIQSLIASGTLVDRGDALSAPGFTVTFTPDQQARIDRYVAALESSPNSPPAPSDFGLDGELVAAIAGLGLVVHLADNVVFSAEQLDRVRDETLAMIDERGSLTLAEFRDHFGSSRKYAQAVLEYFDARRITRRVGDKRVRGSG